MAVKTLTGIFSRCLPEKGYEQLFNNCEIMDIAMSREGREMTVTVHFDCLLPRSVLMSYEKNVLMAYNLTAFKIKPKYDKGLFDISYFPNLLDELHNRVTFVNGIFNKCKVVYENNCIKIELFTGGTELLKSSKCDTELTKLIDEEFGILPKVDFLEAKIENMPKSQLESPRDYAVNVKPTTTASSSVQKIAPKRHPECKNCDRYIKDFCVGKREFSNWCHDYEPYSPQPKKRIQHKKFEDNSEDKVSSQSEVSCGNENGYGYSNKNGKIRNYSEDTSNLMDASRFRSRKRR